MPTRSWILTLVLLGSLSCATLRGSEQGPRWTPVASRVDVLAPDPARDALYVRAGGRVSGFTPKGAPPLPVLPGLDTVPAGALTRVTVTRGVRWRDVRGAQPVWREGSGEAFEPPRSGLPPWSVAAGVLVELPLVGPGQGRPRPVAILGAKPVRSYDAGSVADAELDPPEKTLTIEVPEHARVEGRDGVVLAAFDGRLVRIDTDVGEGAVVDLRGAKAMELTPALGPGGTIGAAAVTWTVPPKTPGEQPKNVAGVFLFSTDGRQLTIPLHGPPVEIHLAAGALWALVREPTDRRLYRYDIRQWPANQLTGREAALLEHRAGLLVGLREHLEARRTAQAVDWLDLLRYDGLLELPSADELALVSQTVALAHPALEKVAREALFRGVPEVANALDRRAIQLDGRRAIPSDIPPLSLRLFMDASRHPAITATDVDTFFSAHPNFVRREEPCEVASSATCLELHFDTRTPPAELRGQLDQALRISARTYLRKRIDCMDDGKVLVDLLPGGPAAAWTCDLDQGTAAASDRFAAALADRHRLSRGTLQVVEVQFDGGVRETLELPPTTGSGELLAEALELALRWQGERDLVHARVQQGARPAAVKALRTFIWRGERADPEVRKAVLGDGALRASWFGGVSDPDDAPEAQD